MSLLNVYLKCDRALVSVDTLSSRVASQTVPASNVAEALKLFDSGIHAPKFAHLAHINAIIAHRGDFLVASIALSALHMAMCQSFDEAAEVMPQLLADTYAQAMALRKQRLGVEDAQGAEIVLVGWSDALNRMEGVRWVRWPQDKGFNASRLGKVLMLPDAEWEQTPEAPDTAERMEAIARDQVAYVRRKHPGYNCGGRLLLAELTRDSLSVRKIADLEVPA